MPVRDSLEAATHSQVVNGTTNLRSAPRMFGTYQYISAFNKAGKFVPGKVPLKLTAVRMKRSKGSGTPCSSTGEDKYLANKGRFSGQAGAYLAYAMNRGPAAAAWDSTLSWNGTPAGHSLQKAYAKMKEAEFDLGVVLGELKETFIGFAQPAKALRKYFNKWNDSRYGGKRPNGSDLLGTLSGTWLEWWYGIYPNILTIQDLIEHINSQSLRVSEKVLRKRGSVQYETGHFLSSSTFPGYYQISGTMRVSETHRYQSAVYYRVLKPLTFGQRYGIDLPSFPSVGWELLRLSFVWDWFYGVGTWLKSVQPTPMFEVLGSTTSYRGSIKGEIFGTALKFYYVDSSARGSDYRVFVDVLERRPNQALPALPSVNYATLSLRKVITSAALMWQLMPRIKR